MILAKVMDEAAEVLRSITGLQVFAYPPETIVPPAGYVSYPRSVDFDETYGRGCDQFTDMPIVLLTGKVTTRAARDRAAQWASGSGKGSVKALAEAHTWQSCDGLAITSAEFDVEKIAGVPYLAVMFKATAVGSGED